MVRKRKIPVRKHHGIRDPLKQLDEREKRLKNVINNPPDIDDGQKLSYKFQQFKNLVDAAQKGEDKLCKFKIHAGVEDLPKTSTKKKIQEEARKFKPIKQLAGEDDTNYLRRVNRMTRESLNEAKYEMKYCVNVIRDVSTGEISIKKKLPNEIDELLKLRRKSFKTNRKHHKKNIDVKTLNTNSVDPQLIKDVVKQIIRKKKEFKNNHNIEHLREYKRDVVQFGEVVHGPPSLLVLPRKAEKYDTVSRPGRKNNLLLKELLGPKEQKSDKFGASSREMKNKANGLITKSQLKGKRKHLSLATRNMLETEQKRMITLYRELKQSKQHQ